MNWILYFYYVYLNSQMKIKISDDNFPTINPNENLVITTHLKQR